MTYIERILQLMEKNNVSAHRLEVDCGLSNASIQSWRNGKCKPSISAIVSISSYFGVSTDYLLKGAAENAEKNLNFNAQGNNGQIALGNNIIQEVEKTDTLEKAILQITKDFTEKQKVDLLDYALQISKQK